jgi:hypothetical protein
MRLAPPLLALFLAACGGTPAADIARAALWPVGGLLIPDREAEPQRLAEWTDEGEAESPAEPALLLSLGARRATATLVQQQGERRLWRSPGGVVVATEGPRIVATAGLSEMLSGTRLDGPDPLRDPRALTGGEARLRRVVDLARAGGGPAGMRFGLALQCRLRAEPEDADTLLVEERCAGGGARFTSRYWADARTGAVFRSEQWIGERTPPLVVEVLSPPAS